MSCRRALSRGLAAGLLSLCWLVLPSPAQQPQAVALINGTVHSGDGPPRQAHLILRGNRIQELVEQVPAEMPVVDLTGLHIYPGLVEADSQLGLVEIESVRGGTDTTEVGDNNADLRPELAVNPDSELLPVARSGGVLSLGLLPTGARISGQVAVLQLSGATVSDMQRVPSPGVVVEWPAWSNLEDDEAGQKWRSELARLEDWVAEARAWARLPLEQRNVRPELDALSQALEQGRLFIRAQSRFQIESALQFCRRHQVRWVLVGGAEAASLAPELARDQVDVIFTQVYKVPEQDYQDFDHYYQTPARLSSAGVRVALAGPHSHDNARWLPQLAACAWAHGWTQAQAEASITRVPCEILGLSEQGRLTSGSVATLIALDGPLLDGRSRVVRAWIEGREMGLEDRQKKLYEKYRNKPRLNF